MAGHAQTYSTSVPPPPPLAPPDLAPEEFPLLLILLVSAVGAIIFIMCLAACWTSMRMDAVKEAREERLRTRREKLEQRQQARTITAACSSTKRPQPERTVPEATPSPPPMPSKTVAANRDSPMSKSPAPGTSSTPSKPGLVREASWYGQKLERSASRSSQLCQSPGVGTATTPSKPGLAREASWYGQKLERSASRSSHLIDADATNLSCKEPADSGMGVGIGASSSTTVTTTPAPPRSKAIDTPSAAAGSQPPKVTPATLAMHFGPPAQPTSATLSEWQIRCQRSFERKASSSQLKAGELRTAAPAPTPVAAGLFVAEVDPSTRAASVAQDATTTARLGPAATPRPGFTRSLSWYGAKMERQQSVGGSISDLTPQKPLLSASPKSPQSERASAQEAVALASEPSIKAAALAPASAVSTVPAHAGTQDAPVQATGGLASVPQLAELVHTRQMASTSLPHSAGAPASSQPKVKPVSTAADSSGAAALRAAEAEAQAARAHDEAERQRARADAARAEADVAKVARAREEAERQQARAEAARAEAEAERQKAQAEASSLEARQAMLEARALRVELNRFKASLATHKQAERTAMADADERATGGNEGRAAVIGTARPSPNAPGRKPTNPIAGINAGATAAAIAACTQARVKVAETPLVSPGATGLTAPPGMDSPSTAPRPVQRRAPTSSSKSKPRLSSGKGTKGATIVDVAQL